jgi:DNA-binding winged helix-turn-helix (wHTH) protein/predicted ATPase
MPHQPLLHFGPYRLDPASGQLWRHDQVLDLPPRALAVLGQLVAQAGQLVTKETLLAAGWPDTAVSEWVLTTCMRALRQALGDDARQPQYIATVHRRGYRFVAAVAQGEAPRPAVAAVRAPAGLVGRDTELAQLHAVLERAEGGHRQLLFITGEAGIGKTTLVEAYVEAVERQGAGWVAWGQCVDAYGPSTGYLPVLEALGRLCQGPAGATVIAHLRQWAPAWLAQLAGVVPPAEHAQLQRTTQGVTRERLLRELAEALEALTATHLLVLVLEDLHWSDASTVDVLALLARRREAARLLVLGTYRPSELVLRGHPLQQATAELHLHGHCEELALHSLQPQAVDAYVAQRFPAPLAHAISPVLYQRTAGHPLFLVHLAAYLAQQVELDRSADADLATRIAAAIDVIPAGVQHLIALQLGRLRADEQRMLEAASLVGVEFAVASVAAAVQVSAAMAETACAALAQHGLFLETSGLAAWPDGTLSGQYRFRHALYQQVLSRRLPEVQRVQGHQRIGTRLEGGYGARAGEIAAELAVHFEQGHDYRRAVHYLQQAAANATRRHASQEIIALATKGVALLHMLPEAPEHLHQELDLQMALGQALIATKGHTVPEVAHAYARARELCEQIGDTSQLFPVLRGLMLYYINRGDLQTTCQLGEQLLRLAQAQNDPASLMLAHYMMGVAMHARGEPAAAHTHHMQVLAIYTPQAHRDLTVRHRPYGVMGAHGCLAWELWERGYPDQALQHSLAARILAQESSQLPFGAEVTAKQHSLAVRIPAQEVSHLYSLAYALVYAAVLHQFRREAQATHEVSEAAMTLSTAQGFALWLAWSTTLHGWALAMQGQGEAGIAQMRQGHATTEAMGFKAYKPYFLSLLAEAYRVEGRPEEGLNTLAEALVMMDTTEMRFYEAELYRLKGALVLQQSSNHAPEAEACFHQALDIARQQQARSWELRAATSLACLWQQQDKRHEAYDLLAPVYGWFTEGFDTADLQEAEMLLEELSQ